MKDVNIKEVIELTFRIYVFLFLNVYAWGKLMGGQFYTPDSIPSDVAAMTLGMADNFDLAWTFMGRSYGYILFIGISQLIGSWMLLFNKTKLLGVAILIPIMVNIIVFDLFFLDMFGALASAIIYFSMLMGILIINKTKIIGVIKILTVFPKQQNKSLKMILYKVSATIILMGVLFLLDQTLVNCLGHGKG
jgi:hypothetical protein